MAVFISCRSKIRTTCLKENGRESFVVEYTCNTIRKGGGNLAARLLKIAAFYFAIAIILGIVMGITKAFSFSSVHAHLNLVGWVSLAIIGLIYIAFPAAAQTKLATWHFWLHNIGLPVMQGSLFLMLLTQVEGFVVGTIIGSLILGVGILLFAINLWQQLKP